MEELARSNPNVRVKKIEIGRRSAVAAQHGVRSLPHLVLYKGSEQEAVGTRAVLSQLGSL